MGAGDNLRTGMSVVEVCCALKGWRFHRVYSPTDPSRYHTWDFINPEETEVLRITFDGKALFLWGAPAQGGQATVDRPPPHSAIPTPLPGDPGMTPPAPGGAGGGLIS